MIKKPYIAVVLLNYNSEEDLFISLKQINNQKNINLITIIIDNNSSEKTVKNIKKWSRNNIEKLNTFSKNKLDAKILNSEINKNTKDTFIIYNNENRGYSAGNNIGIKLADYLNVDAVLIANPDMRFENEKYIYELSKTLFSNKKYLLASSKIIGLDGKDQSPLREASFYEEITWFRDLFPRIFKKTPYVLAYEKNKIITVPKVMGCCLLVKINFLREINYFDENTFLYSEEPILSAQVKQKGGKIVFNPIIEAIHAHDKSQKGNSSKSMLQFIKSRKYYLKKYSGYSYLKLVLLTISYSFLELLYSIKLKMFK